MKINNKDINIEDLVKNDLHTNLHNKINNNIYLNNQEITILKQYDFDPYKYQDINKLIFDIEDYIVNNSEYELEDLEDVLNNLQEFNYYKNTNK